MKIDSIGVEIIKDKMARISAVTKYGFEYLGFSVSRIANSLPESIEFVFKRGDLVLEIVFLPTEVCIGAFVVEISKTDQIEPLNLAQWLKGQGDENWLGKFRLNEYPGSTGQKIDSFFVFLESLFDNSDIKSVLRGDTWSDTPFDWGPNR